MKACTPYTGGGGSRRGAHRATSSAFSNKASAAFVSGKFVAPEMAESGLSTPHTPACSTAREHVNVDAEHITAKQRVAWESKHGSSPRRRWNPGVIEIFVCASVLKYMRLCARALLANNSLHQRVFLQSALCDQGHVVIKQVPEAALSALASGEIVGCGGVWKPGND